MWKKYDIDRNKKNPIDAEEYFTDKEIEEIKRLTDPYASLPSRMLNLFTIMYESQETC